MVLCGCEVSDVGGAAYVWRARWVAACARACGFVSTAARHLVGSQMAHNNSVHAPKPFANGFFCAQHGACTVLAHGFSAEIS
ncbi:MAG: hypothetical protein QY309_04720 [Cyclobacteriaceae bacterium]|nr:MAG: hypothetical protein QY309_04720 [Cyclobacteriaceae bacterium]